MSDTRIQMAEMTPTEAARCVRHIAETTAHASQNWDNFQAIVENMIVAAMDAARKYGAAEARAGAAPPERGE